MQNPRCEGLSGPTKKEPPDGSIECSACWGKGTVPRMGLMIVVDWPCSICRGEGHVPNPQRAGNLNGEDYGH